MTYQIISKLMALKVMCVFVACSTPLSATTLEERDRQSVASQQDLAVGQEVFTKNCLSCHGEGDDGAPRLGNASDWKERLVQNQNTLVRHAIDGHGRMPPKGGFSNLSDSEVAAAVAYVVDRSQKIITALNQKRNNRRCHPVNNPNACSDKDMEDVMTLHMLWLLMGGPANQ